MADWFVETLHPGWGQRFEIVKVLVREQSGFQDILVFESSSHGVVLVLDGCVQITQSDEFVYQEMIAHVPIVEHGRAERVLIIGAGDGGVLRRVLQHRGVRAATMIEIDEAVVRLSKQYLPEIGAGAWQDERAEVIIGDGIQYVAAATAQSVDVIIVDSTDPAGVGEVLFSDAFYEDCARILRPGGIIVTQSGVPFMQGTELLETTRRRANWFSTVTAYVAAVPTYVGGFMALGFASNSDEPGLTSVPQLYTRARASGILGHTRYWTPEVHHAAFQLPPYIAEIMGSRAL